MSIACQLSADRLPTDAVPLHDFLGAIVRDCEGYIEFRRLLPSKQFFVPIGNLDAVDEILRRHHYRDVFFGVAVRTSRRDGSLTNCGALPALFADIDFKNFNSEEDGRARIDACPLAPSVLVHTGGGLHAYWFLNEPLDLQREARAAKAYLRKLARFLQADMAAAEPARILRVPTTTNGKYSPARLVRLEVFEPTRRYHVQDFDDWLSEKPRTRERVDTQDAIPEGSRNTHLTSLAGLMRGRGMAEASISAALLAENEARCRPAMSDHEVRGIARSVGRYSPNIRVLDPHDPLSIARAFVAEVHTVNGLMALRHQNGDFYAYQAGAGVYTAHGEEAARAGVYIFLERAQRWADSKPSQPSRLEPFQPTRTKVNNVLDATRAVCYLPASSAPPCWLDVHHEGIDPFDVLTCQNGLLHIPSRELLPATPNFFTVNALGYPYEFSPPPPERWTQFLAELWPDDPESRDTLQEVFGYLLTPRTRLQKIFMLIGPKRSGKGTIGRVMRTLLGEPNVCGPTLGGMSEQFGLATLIGKSVAMISDARMGGRADTAVITERLLSISGEDSLSVPRKYLPDWTGKLSTRFLIMTNELPCIADSSGALASRFIVLRLQRSFYGHEDHQLFERLLPELPGILNWALAGYDRLHARGRFQQPKRSGELMQQFEDLASPIGTFLRERCEVGAGYVVAVPQLFHEWKKWCEQNGREHPGTIQTLGKNLHAAVPGLNVRNPRVGSKQVGCWEGVGLRRQETD